jgi:hypothetical protein
MESKEAIKRSLEPLSLEQKREFYIFTMILTPSILIAMTIAIGNIFTRLAVQAILLFLQGVILKGIVEGK